MSNLEEAPSDQSQDDIKQNKPPVFSRQTSSPDSQKRMKLSPSSTQTYPEESPRLISPFQNSSFSFIEAEPETPNTENTLEKWNPLLEPIQEQSTRKIQI
jgi:hypothetical protein